MKFTHFLFLRSCFYRKLVDIEGSSFQRSTASTHNYRLCRPSSKGVLVLPLRLFPHAGCLQSTIDALWAPAMYNTTRNSRPTHDRLKLLILQSLISMLDNICKTVIIVYVTFIQISSRNYKTYFHYKCF